MAPASCYLLCGIKSQSLCEKEILAGQNKIFFVIDVVGEKTRQEEYAPTKLDPTGINETPGNFVRLFDFVIPNCAVIPHA
jgi:hypothetical protein